MFFNIISRHILNDLAVDVISKFIIDSNQLDGNQTVRKRIIWLITVNSNNKRNAIFHEIRELWYIIDFRISVITIIIIVLVAFSSYISRESHHKLVFDQKGLKCVSQKGKKNSKLHSRASHVLFYTIIIIYIIRMVNKKLQYNSTVLAPVGNL